MELVRYQGRWHRIHRKPYEPERQTYEIAWMLIRDSNMAPQDAYRAWYRKEQEQAKVLYPTFRKDGR